MHSVRDASRRLIAFRVEFLDRKEAVMVVNFLLALLILVAVVVLVAIIGVLGLWLSGPTSIVFPGLGVVVASGVMLALLVVFEIAVVFAAAHLTRYAVDRG